VTASWDQTLKVWNFAERKMRLTVATQLPDIQRVIFDADGGRLVTLSGGHIVKTWHVESGRALFTLHGALGAGRTSHAYDLAIHPAGERLALGCGDKTVRSWQVTADQEFRHLHGSLGASLSADARLTAGQVPNGIVKGWDTFSGREVLQLPKQRTRVKCFLSP